MWANIIQSVITLLVGGFAIGLYIKQKIDEKQNAARIILIEVQNAEQELEKIRETLRKNTLDIDAFCMPNNSWQKYYHLFSKELDRTEWDAISDFYRRATMIDQAIKYNNSLFANDVEEIRGNKQRMLADYVNEVIKEASVPNQNTEVLSKNFNERIKIFDQIYMSKQGEFAYRPQKPIDDARIYIEGINKISLTSIGQKLKKIAKI